MSKRFALIGAAGYIAPRHMEAIKETGSVLVAAVDKSDSVGIIDSYFPDAAFFTEFERFDRHLEKLKRKGEKVDYVVVCSPNYLHDAHIRFGLRYGADVICEKPVVLNPWNLEALKEIEKETGKKVFTILQMRLLPSLIKLRHEVQHAPKDKRYNVKLTYITPRGNWYYASWKGNSEKSGGIASNIGIHFFDVLSWIFGQVKENIIHIHTHDRAAGKLILDKADIRWFLSINQDTLSKEIRKTGKKSYRSMKVNGESLDLGSDITGLHTMSYQEILDGNGFTLEECARSIQTIFDIRHQKPVSWNDNAHPLTKLPLTMHPFKQ